MEHTLWVNLESKLISLTETDGFIKYVYETELGLQRVLKLLKADGYRVSQLGC